jgi:hypothetical protein
MVTVPELSRPFRSLLAEYHVKSEYFIHSNSVEIAETIHDEIRTILGVKINRIERNSVVSSENTNVEVENMSK